MRVWLLGGFRVSVNSRLIAEHGWRLRQAAALVKLLALAPNHRLHREQVMELLWPDSARRAASNNLRKVLHATRRALDRAEGSRYLASHDEQLETCTPRWKNARRVLPCLAEGKRYQASRIGESLEGKRYRYLVPHLLTAYGYDSTPR